MKKLFAVIWFSIIFLTVLCGVLIFAEKNGNNGKNSNKDTAAPNRTYENLQERPTLPTVAPTQYQSRGAALSGGQGADLEDISGSGTAVSASQADRNYEEQAASQASQKYEFPEEMYPYRALLEAGQRTVYDRIYSAAVQGIRECAVYEMVSRDGIHDIMMSIHNDHPELFWLDKKYEYTYVNSGRVVSVKMNFNETFDDLNGSMNRFSREASGIIEAASLLEGDEAKEKYVYDAIINSVEYVSSSSLNQSAYSALVNKESVCAGYARAFQYIMQKLDIPCYFCSGYSKGRRHAWNIVKIDGEYYNVDISWDDSLGASEDGTYRYYNKKDDEFSAEHTRYDMSALLPRCR